MDDQLANEDGRHNGGRLTALINGKPAEARARRLLDSLPLERPGERFEVHRDEFAGRIAAKVMQTAVAVHEIVFVLADVLFTTSVSVRTTIVMVVALDMPLAWPFGSWLGLSIVSLL